jgi:hypothetical protein
MAAKIIIELDVNLLTVFFSNVNGVIGICRAKKLYSLQEQAFGKHQ